MTTRRTPSLCKVVTILASRKLPVLFERQLTAVFTQKVEEPLVVARVHVEQAQHDLVVAARFLEALVDEIADVPLGDLAVHVHRIDGRPERLAALDETLEEIVGDGPPALAARRAAGLRRHANLGRE